MVEVVVEEWRRCWQGGGGGGVGGGGGSGGGVFGIEGVHTSKLMWKEGHPVGLLSSV